jgi:hypothetical protein
VLGVLVFSIIYREDGCPHFQDEKIIFTENYLHIHVQCHISSQKDIEEDGKKGWLQSYFSFAVFAGF